MSFDLSTPQSSNATEWLIPMVFHLSPSITAQLPSYTFRKLLTQSGKKASWLNSRFSFHLPSTSSSNPIYQIEPFKFPVSRIHPVVAGVPQGSILAPVLYSIYNADMPTLPSTILSTFADDTCIISSHPDPIQASLHLQAT